MGEVVEGGVGIACRTFPRSTIEKVQIELRKEYNVREERKRELEFLENGGNPLDFKLGNVSSASVQSTSFTGQHPDLFATSEAKVSFAFAASPCGDSVESSDKPGPHNCEPNTADNLMLFDAELEFSEGQQTSLPPGRSLVSSEPSFQIDESHKTIDPEDSTAFVLPRKEYKRRYRSRRNRDGIRSGPADLNLTISSHGASLPSRHTLSDVKSLHMQSNFNSDSESLKGDILEKPILPDGLQNIEPDGEKTLESAEDLVKGISDNLASEHLLDNQHNKQLFSVSAIIPALMDSDKPGAIQPMGEMASAVTESSPCATFMEESNSCQKNGFSYRKGDALYNAHKNAPHTILGLEEDLACSSSQNSLRTDGKNGEKFSKMKNINSNGKMNDKKLLSDGASIMEGDKLLKEKRKSENELHKSPLNNEPAADCQNQEKNGFGLQPPKELNKRGSAFGTEAINQYSSNKVEDGSGSGSEPCKISAAFLADNGPENENSCNIEHQNAVDISIPYLSGVSLIRVPSVSFEAQISSGPDSKLGNGNDEDSILKEALIIETKRKRIKELSLMTSPVKIHSKSQWDYVLEEMTWLANDFAQERMWKVAAAAQMCYQASFRSQLRKKENKSDLEAKKVAHFLAKAVIGFWHSMKESCKESEQQSRKGRAPAIVAYAESFLKYNNSYVPPSKAETEVPLTPDRTSDLGILDMSWDDSLTDENVVYTIPPGAMETYRKSIEVYEAQREKFGSSIDEEIEKSEFDAVAGNLYDEDEYDMGEYEMPMVFEGHKSLKFRKKKRKQLTHAFGTGTCEIGSSIVGMQYTNKVATQKSALSLKRPGSSLNVSIPTKRVRTASRRVISPFSAGASGCMVGQNIADVSSGDTSSFQDDMSTLHGESLVPNALESEFGGDFEKQLPFDTAEVSTKLKKKPKHQNASYKQRWQVDSSYQNEQRGHWERRSDVYQLESNGSDGLLGPPMIKKLKMRQSHDNSFDYNIAPVGGLVTSPVTSQMSNMSNPNKIIKVISGCDRDQNRKPNVLKLPACQPGSGSPWSLFEDQALVVLVHDLGPNWELISDAINDTLHFKRIFRKPRDCSERHHVLMDGTSGDGVDSAEDSGSSQLYPSTLPGIPKGSARQLFQRLQEPLDEETLKSHFDKIIILGQKQHNRKTQDPKQLQQSHGSHTAALSQICPNNLNGALVLTPLDFYETTLAGQNMLPLGYQGPTSSLLAYPNQGNAAAMLPSSGVSTSIQGSTLMLSNSFPTSPGSFTSATRYGAPRSIDDQQRMQQYGQMISGRNISQHNMTAPGALTGNDRCVRVVPGGNGMGLVGGISRNMPTARPGLQGVVSSSMLNSGSVTSPVMISANMQSGIGSGMAMLRPRETAHMMRDSQRQMMVPDLQMQVSPAISQGMPIFGGLSSAFPPNHTSSPPVSSYPLHQQQSHPISPRQPQGLSPHHPHFQGAASHLHNPQQQAYAIRLAKERQLKQRFLQQQPQKQQFAMSDSLAPHVQSQPQHPTSSPMRNSSEMKSQTISLPVSSSPLTTVSSMNSLPQSQQKCHTPIQIIEHDAQTGSNGSNNQTDRQRQRQHQHFSQANRQHPQQRQQSQSQQQTKILNRPGGGNMAMHQTVASDPSLLNEVSMTPGNQCLEKGEHAAPLMQSQCLYTGPTQKVYLGQTLSSKHLHQMTSHSDATSHGHVSPVAHTGLSAAQQSAPSLTVPGANLTQATTNQKLVSAINGVVCPTGPINSDPPNKPQTRELDTVLHQKSVSSELSTTAAMDSNDLNSESNLSSLPSTISGSIEHVAQAEQGLGRRPTPASLPTIKHGVNMHWQQQSSHLQHSQHPHPPHQLRPTKQQQQQQQPSLIPLHSQQQTKLLQAGNGNLYGRPSDAGI